MGQALVIAGATPASQQAADDEKDSFRTAHESLEKLQARYDFNLAIARWKSSRTAKAIDLLEKIPRKHRFFEWYLARREFEGSDMTLFGHSGGVKCVAYSPDGLEIVSGSFDNQIKLWEDRSGHEIKTLLQDHLTSVMDIEFSPDGTSVVFADAINQCVAFDVKKGAIRWTVGGGVGSGHVLAYSPDGEWVARSGVNCIDLLDAKTGEKMSEMTYSRRIQCMAFSPDSTRIVSGSWDRTVQLWDLATGRLVRTLEGHPEAIRGVAFSPDGLKVASVGGGRLMISDASSGRELWTNIAGTGINCVEFSPDATLVASASDDGTISVWDSLTGMKRRRLRGHVGPVLCLDFSPDGSRLVSGSADGTIKRWDVRAGSRQMTLKGHTSRVEEVFFAKNTDWIASGSSDGTIRIWDMYSGQNVKSFRGVGGAFSPDGTLLATRNWFEISLWDVHDEKELWTNNGNDNKILSSVCFSPEGTRIASASQDGTIKIWDVANGNVLHTISGHADGVYSIRFSPDGKQLASGSWDSKVKLWEVETGKLLSTFSENRSLVHCVAFSPDGSKLAAGSEWNVITLWNIETGKKLMTYQGHQGRVSSLAFSQDGTRLASGSFDHTIKLWDVQTGEDLRTLRAHCNLVHCVAFSPDGDLLVSGGEDKTVKLWDARKIGEYRTIINHDQAWPRVVSFGEDGETIYSINDDFKAWNMQSRTPVDLREKPKLNTIKTLSPDGRWLAVPRATKVLLVDTEYKDQHIEKSFREAKSGFDSNWHLQMALISEKNRDWFAATFHWAWVVWIDLDQHKFRRSLQTAYAEFEKENENQKEKQRKKSDPLLIPLVREMLILH